MKFRPLPVLMIAATALAAVGAALVVRKVDAQSASTLSLAQEPLFLINRIKPNFIMAVDDSGSMDFEVLFRANDGSAWWNVSRRSFFGLGETDAAVTGEERNNFNSGGVSSNTEWKKYSYLFPLGTGTDGKALGDGTNDHFAIPPTIDFAWARSGDYNRAYFNPQVTYTPWLNYNSTPFPQVVASSAPADPQRGTKRINLTADIVVRGDESEFMFHRYMRIPTGTWYRVSECFNGGVNPTNTQDTAGSGALTGYRQARADRTVGGTEGRSRCSISIAYFPATFYIRDTNGRANAIAAAIGYKTTAIDRTAQSPGDANGNGKFTLARFEIKPDNFSSGTTYQTAIDNFANWFSYYRKRHQATRAGLTQAFDGFDFINAGYFTINNRNNVTMRDMALASPRQAIYTDILSLAASGGTPNKDAVDHLGKQFRRTGTGAPVTLACQRNFGMLFTDGFSQPTTAAAYGNVDGALPVPFRDGVSNTLADIATRHYLDNLRPDLEAGKVPVPNQCSGTSPDLRLDCRRDPHMNFYGITLGSRGQVYNPDANPAQDPFANPPAWPTNFPAYHPAAVDDIWHASLNTRGKFLNARTPKEISDAIRNVLISVQDASIPAGRDATSGARVSADTFFVIPSFGTRNNGTDWPGSLVAYRIQSDGTLGSLLWASSPNDAGDAGDKLPAHGDRNLFTTTTPGIASVRQVQNLTATNLGSSDTARYTKMGLSTADVATYPGLTPTRAVDYLRGDQTHEQVTDSSGVIVSGTLRARSSRLGDIVNSTPVIFTKQENFGFAALPGTAGTSYTTFLQNRRASNQQPVVYVGANDGYLHAFSGTNGSELFGFMPNGALSSIGRLLNPKYQHQYYVDGPIAVSDAQVGGSWGTVLVGSTGAGSKSLFALNVTNPSGVGASQVMWELSGTSNADIGHMLGRALIVPVNGGTGPRWVALVGNGYNSTYGKPALLVLDLATGQTLATLRPEVTGTEANGLGNIVAIADANGYASTVYGGDLAGNVWKFNLGGSNASAWGVALGGSPLFQARDASNVAQPITGGFDVAKGPNNGIYVFFGTGRYFANGDNQIDSNTQIQSLYGILDTGTPVSGRGALAQRRILSESSTTPKTRALEQGTVNYITQRGWYVDLRVQNGASKGERFIGFPRVEGGQIYFATFEPIGDACTPGGVNWLYGLDALTGSAALSNLRIPGVDSDGDGQEDTLCTTNCGGVETGAGAPANDTVVLVPQPPCVPGTVGCAAPILCRDDPTNPGCKDDDDLDQDDLYQGCVKVVSVGGKQIVQPRACGRQSWRQVQ